MVFPNCGYHLMQKIQKHVIAGVLFLYGIFFA